ncbi:hypothetical protein Tco_1107851 [Tanacetum coccineum]
MTTFSSALPNCFWGNFSDLLSYLLYSLVRFVVVREHKFRFFGDVEFDGSMDGENYDFHFLHCCLPGNILYNESDLTMTKLRVSLPARGGSPIMTSYELPLSMCTWPASLPKTLAFIMTGAEELLPLVTEGKNDSFFLIISMGALVGVATLSFFPSTRFLDDFALFFFIPFTRWESCPDFTASSIWLINWRQSLVSCL